MKKNNNKDFIQRKKKRKNSKLELSQRKVSDNLNHKQIMTGERRLARMWYAKYSHSRKKFRRRIKTSIFCKRSSYPGAKRKDSMKIPNHSVLLFKSGRFVFRDLFFKYLLLFSSDFDKL